MKYYASEIDKYAMKITEKNHPETVQIGDVRNVDGSKFEGTDLLIGGSPCQGFSFAGKQLNFKDDRSILFFEFVRIFNECKPKYFLMENVRMKKEYQDIISKFLGVEPISIDSNLLSAQNRKRLYWTNIPGIKTPEDLEILLKDVVHENTDLSMESDSWIEWWKKNAEFQLKKKYSSLDGDKAITMTARQYASWNGNFIFEKLNEYIVPFDKTVKILDREVERGKVGYFRKDRQGNRVYYIHNKAITLMDSPSTTNGVTTINPRKSDGSQTYQQNRVYDANGKMVALTAGLSGRSNILFGVTNRARGNNPGGLRNDGSKCPTISAHHWEHNNHLIFGCITPDRINKRQNGQRFNEGNKFYTLTAQDRHGVLVEGYIRKLTPIECERLQTLPDNYTEGVSNYQRYKMLGNGWTVAVIKHIFKHLPEGFLENPDLKVVSLFDGMSCGQQAIKELLPCTNENDEMYRVKGCGEIIETISADIHTRCGDAEGGELCDNCSQNLKKGSSE